MSTTQIPFQQASRPGFLADVSSREHILAGGAKIKASDFVSADAIKVAVSDTAAMNATTVPVAALKGNIPSGATLSFGGKKFATLTADAAAGATALTVSAIPTALGNTDVAYYSPPGIRKRIPAGTLVGLAYGKIEAAAVVTGGVPAGVEWEKAGDSDDVVRLVVHDVVDADQSNDVDLLREGTLVYVNHIPGWSELSPTLKTKVRATYELTTAGTEV